MCVQSYEGPAAGHSCCSRSGVCVCVCVYVCVCHVCVCAKKISNNIQFDLTILPSASSASNEHVQRQAAKALANLGVNADNKVTKLARPCRRSYSHSYSLSFAKLQATIARKGGITPLISLAETGTEGVQIEAVAALANLAVNDDNEGAIGTTTLY